MFISLLVGTFAISLLTTFIMAKYFNKPIGAILQRLIKEEIFSVWQKYMIFAMYVVGISNGVKVFELEKYITAPYKDAVIVMLTVDRAIMEIYDVVIDTIQGVAWLLSVFFFFALFAWLIVRVMEAKKEEGKKI